MRLITGIVSGINSKNRAIKCFFRGRTYIWTHKNRRNVCPQHNAAFIYVGIRLLSRFKDIMKLLCLKIRKHSYTSEVKMWESINKVYSKAQPQGLSSSIRGQMPPEHECTAARPHSHYQGETHSGGPSKAPRGHRRAVLPLRLPQNLIYFKKKVYSLLFNTCFKFFNYMFSPFIIFSRNFFLSLGRNIFSPVCFIGMHSPKPDKKFSGNSCSRFFSAGLAGDTVKYFSNVIISTNSAPGCLLHNPSEVRWSCLGDMTVSNNISRLKGTSSKSCITSQLFGTSKSGKTSCFSKNSCGSQESYPWGIRKSVNIFQDIRQAFNLDSEVSFNSGELSFQNSELVSQIVPSLSIYDMESVPVGVEIGHGSGADKCVSYYSWSGRLVWPDHVCA